MITHILSPIRIIFLSVLILSSGAFCLVRGQEPEPPGRDINSGDFDQALTSVSNQIVRNRRKTAKASGALRAKNYTPRRRVPRMSLKVKFGSSSISVGAGRMPPKPSATSGTGWEEIGFTVWKLRRKIENEDSPSVSVIEKGLRVEYVPERLESDSALKLGDKVRLTIESPRDGYLYVADTEIYGDGTFGNPTLIFPTQRTRGGNNRVSAGVLIDIPVQTDDVPFFVINSKNPIYAGELLSVLIVRESLPGIAPAPRAKSLEPELFEDWSKNWGLDAEVFEETGGNGVKWTNAEQEAGTVGGRSLAQEDPSPQTLYRVRADSRKPIFVNLPLRVIGK